MTSQEMQLRQRSLFFMADPSRWPQYPFLPLVRRQPHDDDDPDLGVLYDAWGMSSIAGHRVTVFLGNLLLLPSSESELLSGPREVFDRFEDIVEAGWRVD